MKLYLVNYLVNAIVVQLLVQLLSQYHKLAGVVLV